LVSTLAMLMLVAACAGPTTPASSTPVLIRVGYGSGVDLGDIPSLIAHQHLIEQGYQVEVTNFATLELAVTAATDGKIDVLYDSPKLVWTAIAQGANLALIGEQNANTLLVETDQSIQSCADLDGQPFGIQSEVAVSISLLRKYMEENCPTAQPQFVVVAGSENRAAGLLAHQLKGAILEVADSVQLELKAPDQYHVLSDFSQDLPNFVVYGLSVNTEFAQQHATAVHDYLKANLEANRAVAADHSLVLTEAVRVLEQDQTVLQPLVDKYFAINAWDQNGGLTSEKVNYSYDFLVSLGGFEVNLTLEQRADLSYLNAVLDELGQR